MRYLIAYQVPANGDAIIIKESDDSGVVRPGPDPNTAIKVLYVQEVTK